MVIFGDSGVDTGNFARSSNGPVWVETLAAWFGLPAPRPSENGGSNYAWGGARTGYELDWVPQMSMYIPGVGMQIEQFLSQHTPDPQQLFVLRAGGNDYGVHHETDPTVPVSNLVSHVLDLSEAGARHVLVSNTEPFGYIPLFLDTPDEVTANQFYDSVSLLLTPAMTALEEELGIAIYQFDAHGVMNSVLDDPSRFGLTNVTSPASDAGGAVPHPEEYMFWDDVHFTTAMHSILGKAAAEAVASRLGSLTLIRTPAAVYDAKDSDSDSMFDNAGDSTSDRSSSPAVAVGERDTPNGNAIVRLLTKFELPLVPNASHRLEQATLRLFLEDIVGTPAGPASLLHSVGDNGRNDSPSDFEDASYTDTQLELVQPNDLGQQYYELDVTGLVLSDYAADNDDLMSAFRLQVDEAVFLEDDESHRYRFTMPGAGANPPELVLTFIPEPSALVLAIVTLGSLIGWRNLRRTTATLLVAALLMLATDFIPPADANIYRWDNGELITEKDAVPGGGSEWDGSEVCGHGRCVVVWCEFPQCQFDRCPFDGHRPD